MALHCSFQGVSRHIRIIPKFFRLPLKGLRVAIPLGGNTPVVVLILRFAALDTLGHSISDTRRQIGDKLRQPIALVRKVA